MQPEETLLIPGFIFSPYFYSIMILFIFSMLVSWAFIWRMSILMIHCHRCVSLYTFLNNVYFILVPLCFYSAWFVLLPLAYGVDDIYLCMIPVAFSCLYFIVYFFYWILSDFYCILYFLYIFPFARCICLGLFLVF